MSFQKHAFPLCARQRAILLITRTLVQACASAPLSRGRTLRLSRWQRVQCNSSSRSRSPHLRSPSPGQADKYLPSAPVAPSDIYTWHLTDVSLPEKLSVLQRCFSAFDGSAGGNGLAVLACGAAVRACGHVLQGTSRCQSQGQYSCTAQPA